MKALITLLAMVFVASTANAKIVVRNGYTLDVVENGCTIDVVPNLFGADYIRIQGWNHSSNIGSITKRVVTAWGYNSTLGSLPLRDGSHYGHQFSSLFNGACYARNALSYANNDCYIRENSGTLSGSGSPLVQYVYEAAFLYGPYPQRCSLKILRKG